jgi:galactonate dehydratase
MSNNDAIRQITLSILAVSPKTKWAFVEVETSSGVVGVGEATLGGQEMALEQEMRRIGPHLIGAAASPGSLRDRFEVVELPAAAIVSAIDQAFCDLAARGESQSLCQLLGQRRSLVNTYANINRCTEPRTPQAFAESARKALAAGFKAVKIAPFDEVTPATATLARAAKGLERISEVSAVLASDVSLYVDCHWRFTPDVAAEIIAPLQECGVTWYECPIAETEEHVADLRQLRHLANNAGMVLAGLEHGIGSARFETFARAGAYDIMMPDIKYIGGIDIMVETANGLARHGVALSLHNPTSPICHAASLAVCGALDRVGLLEMQFDETPFFDRLVSYKLASPIAGHVSVPTSPGLGVSLDPQALAVLSGYVVVID